MKKAWDNWVNTGSKQLHGGQGRIFFVKDKTGRNKGVYALEELINPKRQDRFEREITAICDLTEHANIIKLVDKSLFGREKAKPYYVMEKADCSLVEYLSWIKGNVSEIMRTFDQICEGLSFIHENEIIHRDLKPANILFVDGVAKIADFGLCLFIDSERLTAGSEAVGSRYYMAPELEDGRNLKVDFSADVYSLGKILYFMFSGGKMFSREKYYDRENDLETTYKDSRFRHINNLFAKTIVEKPHSRLKSVSDVKEMFHEEMAMFLQHPRTTLIHKTDIKKGSKISQSVISAQSLTGAEVKELLDMILNGFYDCDVDLIRHLAENPDLAFLNSLVDLIGKKFKMIEPADMENIARQLFLDDNIVYHLMHDLLREKTVVPLATVALDTGDHKVVSNIAENCVLFGRRYNEVLAKLMQHHQLLEGKPKVTFLTECVFCDFEDKYSFFKRELTSERRSLEEYEAVIAGLASSMDKENLDEFVSLGEHIATDEEKQAFGRGLVLGLSQNQKKDVVYSLDGNDFSDPVLSILINAITKSGNGNKGKHRGRVSTFDIS